MYFWGCGREETLETQSYLTRRKGVEQAGFSLDSGVADGITVPLSDDHGNDGRIEPVVQLSHGRTPLNAVLVLCLKHDMEACWQWPSN
jgi:hypothetical protein